MINKNSLFTYLAKIEFVNRSCLYKNFFVILILRYNVT
ncbi:hypothetical protein [uncultured Gammaproteobacteria bacterium]|nr:hypothetical protein [uncultured Gammaproteobacteria bacterium]CAC9573042.1 hypothetical protein [uncultured Gammaproteobacteria bacterium]